MTVPLNEIEWTGSYFATERWMQLEANGLAMINSAEEPFLPQHRAWFDDSMIVKFNTLAIDLVARSRSVNTVNDALFMGFAAHIVKLSIWEFRLLFDVGTGQNPEGEPYIEHVIHYHLRDGSEDLPGWDWNVPDYGTQTIGQAAAADPKDRYIKIDIENTDKATYPSGNLLLNGAGQFNPIQTAVTPSVDTFTYEHFKATDFSTLPAAARTLPPAMGGP